MAIGQSEMPKRNLRLDNVIALNQSDTRETAYLVFDALGRNAVLDL